MTDGGGLKGLELYFSSEKAEKAADRFRQAMEAAAAGVIHTGTAVDALDKSFDKLGRTTGGAAAPVGRTGEAAGTAGNRMRDGANRARDFQKGLLGMGVSADTASKGLTRLVTAAGGFFALRKVVTTLADTEDKLRILQSVTGATAAEMRKLGDAANAITINGRASFGEATQALIELGKAGASASASQAALADISNLSRAGLISMSEAAETVVNTYAQFGLTLKDSARISDVLVKAADSTTSSVGSLADSLAKVGPIGRELGVSFEEITAAVAILQQNGEKAQVAGTGLGRVLKQLADPANGAEGAAQAIRDLGLSFSDINPRDFARALDNLAASNLTLKQATALVGEEFDRILISLVRNRKEIAALGGQLGSAFGDAANKAAATVGTLGESMDQFNNAVERLILRSGDKGLSGFLKSVVIAGRDALNVLSGDAKAMKDASTAGVVLANTAKGAAVALAALGTLNTIGRLSDLGKSAYGAGLSIGKLWGVVRANPFGVFVSLATAATTAFALFGDTVDKSKIQVDEFLERTREAKAAAAQFDEIRQRLLSGAGGDASKDQEAALRKELLDLRKLQSEVLQDPGRDKVPAERILASIQNAAPEAAARLRSLIGEVERLREAGSAPNRDTLNEIAALSDQLRKAADLQLLVEREAFKFGAFTDTDKVPIVGLYVKLGNAIQVVSKELNRVTGDSNAAQKALAGAAEASKALASGRAITGGSGGSGGGGAQVERAKLDAVQQLIRERLQEADLTEKSAGQQLRVKLLQDAINASIAAGRPLRVLELAALEAIAKKQDAIAQAEKGKDVGRVLQGLQNENELLQAQGVERSALRRQQEVLNTLAAQGVKEGSDAYQQALALLDVNRQLLENEEQRRSATRRDDLFKRLRQDEASLRLVGEERDRYIAKIEAQNDAEQAGLAQGTSIYDDYVRRRQALEELARASEEVGQFFGQMGQSAGSALERIAIDSENARDAVRALWQDLQRMAFQKSVTNNLQKLFEIAGEAAADYFGGGSSTPQAGPDSPTGQAGITNSSSRYGGNQYWQYQTGGIIPAMTGQIVAASSFLQRGDQRYSVAEGGAVTPEAVFPLARDARGRLGVVGAGGGGGDNVTMVFPSVRNAQDARQVRATRSQIARRIGAADRSGRRGLRPRGE